MTTAAYPQSRDRDEHATMPGWARALFDELRALRLAVDRQQGRSTLSRDDWRRLVKILPVAVGVHGSEPFLSADIVESDAPALRLTCAGLSVRQLGRLLRRAAGVPVAGYMVERVASEAGCVLWQVVGVGVSEFPQVQNPRVPRAAIGAARDST